MDNLIIYGDDKIESIEDWDLACKRFEWLTKVWPEVLIQKWCWKDESYKTIAHFRKEPFVTMCHLRETYMHKIERRMSADNN